MASVYCKNDTNTRIWVGRRGGYAGITPVDPGTELQGWYVQCDRDFYFHGAEDGSPVSGQSSYSVTANQEVYRLQRNPDNSVSLTFMSDYGGECSKSVGEKSSVAGGQITVNINLNFGGPSGASDPRAVSLDVRPTPETPEQSQQSAKKES